MTHHNQSLTRSEAERQIAELQRHIASLPTHNHPDNICIGMLFKLHDDIYMVTGGVNSSHYLHMVSGDTPGCVKSGMSLWGNHAKDKFTYLGHARDLLTIKSHSNVVVTDEMITRAERAYCQFDGNTGESIRHVIELVLSGKL